MVSLVDEYRPSVRLVACNCEDAPAPRIPQSVLPLVHARSDCPDRAFRCLVGCAMLPRSAAAPQHFAAHRARRKRRSHGATRMSESVHFSTNSPIQTAGLHPLARALFLSFCVHAILLGVVWQIWSTRQQSLQHILNVELAPAANAMTAPAAAPPAPGEIRNDGSAAKNKTRSNRVVHASAATPLVAPVERVDVESTSPKVLEDTPAAPAAARSMPSDAPAIDLRILDWLAQYRTYPLAARRARIEGVVQLRVTLLPDGTLTDARIEHSSGHAILDRAALELLSRAARLPDDFGSTRSGEIELQLPIVYRMRT